MAAFRFFLVGLLLFLSLTLVATMYLPSFLSPAVFDVYGLHVGINIFKKKSTMKKVFKITIVT